MSFSSKAGNNVILIKMRRMFNLEFETVMSLRKYLSILAIVAFGTIFLSVANAESVYVNQQIKIPVDFSNDNSESQPFAYIVQITNEIGQAISISYITGSLGAGQTLEQTLSYVPQEAGNYKVEKFLWSDMNNPLALTVKPESTIISVAESPQQNVIQQSPQQTVQTELSIALSKSSYNENDLIIISGTASSTLEYDAPITLRILNSDQNIVSTAQVYPNSYGVYSHTLIAGGSLWSDAGIYQVLINHGAEKTAKAFNFSGSDETSTAPIEPEPVVEEPVVVVENAVSTTTIQNAQGSSTPGCEPDCYIPRVASIEKNALITFENNDTAAHTTTSGTPSDGPSGIWDSSLMMNGQSFSVRLSDVGEYPYFCMVHPWMIGTILVVDGERVPQTGFVSIDGSVYEIQYNSQNVEINSITADLDFISLEFKTEVKNSGGDISITFDRDFFDSRAGTQDDNFVILADGNEVNFSESKRGNLRTLSFSLSAGVEEIEIIGTKIVDNSFLKDQLDKQAEAEAAAQAGILNIETTEFNYNAGDPILLLGNVGVLQDNMSVTIRVFNPSQNLITTSETTPDQNHNFTIEIETSIGGLWSESGIYTIIANYYQSDPATTQFYINPEQIVPSSGLYTTVENAQGSSTPGCEPDCFIPATVTIGVGGMVTFANNDSAAHTSTSGTQVDGPSGIWDSSLVMTGSAYTTPALAAGEYPYFCMVHPWMNGLVIVEEESDDDTNEIETSIISPTLSASECQTLAQQRGHDNDDHLVCQFPFDITVNVGERVAWMETKSWEGIYYHTITSVDGFFDMTDMGSTSFLPSAWNGTGVYNYYDKLNPSLTGTITVVQPEQEQTSSTASTLSTSECLALTNLNSYESNYTVVTCQTTGFDVTIYPGQAMMIQNPNGGSSTNGAPFKSIAGHGNTGAVGIYQYDDGQYSGTVRIVNTPNTDVSIQNVVTTFSGSQMTVSGDLVNNNSFAVKDTYVMWYVTDDTGNEKGTWVRTGNDAQAYAATIPAGGTDTFSETVCCGNTGMTTATPYIIQVFRDDGTPLVTPNVYP
jgi:plastocyanin